MENFTFCSPTFFAFGRGEENNAGLYAKRFGATKVLVHYGSESAKKSGLLDRVCDSLTKQGIDSVLLGGVKPNPRGSLVYEGIALCRREKVDFILAVGGGSVIDSAKAIGIGVPYEGDFWDFYIGKAEPKKTLPVGTVLTLAAAGSEGSVGSVISREEGDGLCKRPCDNELLRPCFSILNPELTMTVSPYQTACGATDIMAHVMERYFTNSTEVAMTDRICEAVLRTIVEMTPRVLENPADYDARANFMWAGMLAHNNLCGVDRQQDWASHNLEHELSALYDCAHGAGLAVVFPAWMDYVMEHDVMRFAQFAVRVWGCEMDFECPERTARAGILAFRSFLRSIGMPLTFAELGAKREDIPRLLEQLEIDGRTEGSFVPLDRAACLAIYEGCCR